MKKLVLLCFVGSLYLMACEQPPSLPLSHEKWDGLLQQYVDSNGNVDYAGMQAQESVLNDYLDILKANAPESTWASDKEMAYWINLYNAFTVHLILKHYPINSIMDLDNGDVWNVQTISIGGENLTLNQIEQHKLLTKFGETRVHFAVNCAAASCPPLLNRAWTESNIQQNYNTQANLFINDSSYNTLSLNTIDVSQIFNWYASDFGGANNIVPYIQQYSNTMIDNSAMVTYKPYDWALNSQ